MDELCHASVHDGIKTCRAKKVEKWKHNDTDDLRRRLEIWFYETKGTSQSNVIVTVESLYSMDGDIAPLKEIVEVLEEFGGRAVLVVDEAHATGVFGAQGRGLVSAMKLETRVFARLTTFGKALGCHGAVVLGSAALRSYLINYARPLVYSTFLPTHGLLAIRSAYEIMMDEAEDLQMRVQRLIDHFRAEIGSSLPQPAHILPSTTPIQGIVVPGNAQTSRLALLLRERGFDVRPIRSPTVPKGVERVRVCIHAHNTVEEVEELAKAVKWAVQVVVRDAAQPQSTDQAEVASSIHPIPRL
ncbi:hypothetical protein HK104_009973 [Borealophlyctis nickersoniae]|nr:hypothetical protein HK104_009973 [Borealophlyctis nickersoniae]